MTCGCDWTGQTLCTNDIRSRRISPQQNEQIRFEIIARGQVSREKHLEEQIMKFGSLFLCNICDRCFMKAYLFALMPFRSMTYRLLTQPCNVTHRAWP